MEEHNKPSQYPQQLGMARQKSLGRQTRQIHRLQISERIEGGDSMTAPELNGYETINQAIKQTNEWISTTIQNRRRKGKDFNNNA